MEQKKGESGEKKESNWSVMNTSSKMAVKRQKLFLLFWNFALWANQLSVAVLLH